VPSSPGQFIEEVKQEFQKELKEFMDQTFQKGLRIHGQSKPINIWPNDRRGRKNAMERKLK